MTSGDRFARAIRAISRLCGVIGAALVALAVVIVCQMVFVRYVLMTRGHVNVNVLPLHLPSRPRFILALGASIMSIAFCAVMTVLTFLFWKEAWDNRWVSDTMWRARLWIPYSAMPIGLGLLTLQYVVDIIALVTGREAPFDIAPDGKSAS